jgi:predicted aspartyl protease
LILQAIAVMNALAGNACLLAFISAGLSAQTIPLKSRGPLMLIDVRLNGEGPFHMILDTGASSCSVTPEVAARLRLQTTRRVSDITVTGQRMVPVTQSVELEIGGRVAGKVEFLVQSMETIDATGLGIDGVVGQSFLSRYDYLIDYRAREFTLDPEEPGQGKRIRFSTAWRRILIPAMDPAEGSLRLVLDSGASNLFLWRRSEPSSRSTTLIGLNGRRSAGLLRLPVLVVGDQVIQKVDAVVTPSPDTRKAEDGLLPAGFFQSVYVNNSQSFVKLRR